MQKKLLLGTNLKMYKTASETAAYLSDLSNKVGKLEGDAEFFVIPSFTSLPAAISATKTIRLGAQNMYWEEKGQFTGEISPLMLKDLGGISIIEIGHSERRHVFGETSEECNQKVKAALDYGFTALLCVGETSEQKQYNISDETLNAQIKIGLSGVEKTDLKRIWIAYEPVWSIGVNGTPASSDYVRERCKAIKRILTVLFGDEAEQIPILYGGSVNNTNADDLIENTDIDGLFIGRAAWNAENFYHLSEHVIDIWKKKYDR